MEEEAKLKESAKYLQEKLGDPPRFGCVLGSGLGETSQKLKNAQQISTKEIPHAPISTAIGHRGVLARGDFYKHSVAFLSGRVHAYEGYDPHQVVFLVRSLFYWGVRSFVLTNASGSLHDAVKPGSMLVIKDHLNFTGENPLYGKELFGGPRFCDVTNLYHKNWRSHVLERGKDLPIEEGVYVGVRGPSYETPAEVKALHRLGGDVVGMSTIWESLALHQMGAKILCISCVANYGTGVSQKALSGQEVLEAMQKLQPSFEKLLRLSFDEASENQ